jgi:hypothetical protein
MPFTKLCARGGCTGIVTASDRSKLERRKFCTRTCGAIARLCAGWTPQESLLRPEVRKVACRRGALAYAAKARRIRAKAITERLAPLLQHTSFQGMEAEYRAAVLAAIGKAYRLGKADGYQRGWHAKSTLALKRSSVGGEYGAGA